MTTSTPRSRPGITALGRAARPPAVAGLAGIALLHAAWGNGFAWPLASRTDLSEAVLGSPGLADRDSAGACYAMAGALGVAAALVAGRNAWNGRGGWRSPGSPPS